MSQRRIHDLTEYMYTRGNVRIWNEITQGWLISSCPSSHFGPTHLSPFTIDLPLLSSQGCGLFFAHGLQQPRQPWNLGTTPAANENENDNDGTHSHPTAIVLVYHDPTASTDYTTGKRRGQGGNARKGRDFRRGHWGEQGEGQAQRGAWSARGGRVQSTQTVPRRATETYTKRRTPLLLSLSFMYLRCPFSFSEAQNGAYDEDGRGRSTTRT